MCEGQLRAPQPCLGHALYNPCSAYLLGTFINPSGISDLFKEINSSIKYAFPNFTRSTKETQSHFSLQAFLTKRVMVAGDFSTLVVYGALL